MPGVYSEQVTMKPYVDIEGSGELTTKITYTGGSGDYSSGTVTGANNAELRHLTVETVEPHYAVAINNQNSSPRLTHVTATATGGGDVYGVFNHHDSAPVMTHVTATASGEGPASVCATPRPRRRFRTAQLPPAGTNSASQPVGASDASITAVAVR